MTVYTVNHITTYNYARPVALGDHLMMFRPRDSYDQRLVDSGLLIAPEPVEVTWRHDVFGNCVARANFNCSATSLRFESTIRVEHFTSNAPKFQTLPEARNYPFLYDQDELPDLAPWLARCTPDVNDEVGRWARRFLSPAQSTPTGKLLMTMTRAIKESFTYVTRPEPGTQSPETTLFLRRGTCRDFALLMIEAARTLGLAARFVSGYIHVPPRNDGMYVGGGSTHAWCEVYIPGAGWIEFDPTNGIVGNRDLIRVAVARDPAQAIPLHGSYIGTPADNLGMVVDVMVTSDEPYVPELLNQAV